MMGRLKSDQGQLFYEFHLSDAVPEDHLVRKIDTALDLFWLRSHDTANPRRVFISGRKRGVFGAIECELRRRSAIEPVIGHRKTDGHLGRCHLNAETGTLQTSSSPLSATICVASSPG